MYIILRGSVNVRVTRIVGDYKEDKIVTVLYDGYTIHLIYKYYMKFI